MRFSWIVTILCTLASMGLLMIILSQTQVMIMMNKDSDRLPNQIKKLDGDITNLGPYKNEFQLLLDHGKKEQQDLEGNLANMEPEIKKKAAELDNCLKEKNTRVEEVGSMEKERAELEAKIKSESDAWKQEIVNLNSQLVEYRPICDHVKNNTIVLKLCGKKGPTAPPAPPVQPTQPTQPAQPAARR